jgi:hypothetical protein
VERVNFFTRGTLTGRAGIKKPATRGLRDGLLFVLGDYLLGVFPHSLHARIAYLRHSSLERVRRAFCIAVVMMSVMDTPSAIMTASMSSVLIR